jgi:capsular exopolysaccharide synthesis family protein
VAGTAKGGASVTAQHIFDYQSGSEVAFTFAPQLVTLSSAPDPRADAIRALRTHVVAQHLNHGRRALAVCAASPGVGCTFIAANLAVALSQIGLKTALIDADLHTPSIGSLITPSHSGEGLAHCLASTDVNFYQVIHEARPNLSVLLAGGVAADAQELLGGERFRDLMAMCLRDFDVTIIDTPPANRFSDARRVSTVVGYALIVAARDKTFVEDVKTLASQLQADHAHVIGTVLNSA